MYERCLNGTRAALGRYLRNACALITMGGHVSLKVDLGGKVALVTGASSGLGNRFARILARSGAQVVLASRRVDRLKETRAEIEAEGGAAHVVAMDVTDLASIQAAVAEAVRECGGIDILINNSGVSTTSRLVDVTPDDYDFVFNTNTRGAFFVAQTVAKHMIERAKAQPQGAPYGRIVNIASVAGLKVLAQIGTYAMSKAAVIQMTKAMALEWGRFNINVNAICPGYIVTELNAEHFNSPAGQKLVQVLPRKRAGEPGDLDGLILLLSSDNSNFINGAVITADDGLAI